MKYLYILVVVFFTSTDLLSQQKRAEIVQPEFGLILDSLGVSGAILIYDVQKNSYYSNNFSWAKTGVIPASTFKIPNSIIALETRVVDSDTTVFKWDGQKRRFSKWEADLNLKLAFQVSCVPCYQEIARKVGVKRMKSYLKKLNYPGMVFDTLTIDNFWLKGKSKISQMEQVDFLERFYFSKLPISIKTELTMKDIMIIDNNENYILSGKTGWGMRGDLDNGWLVGYLEVNSSLYFFATNIEMKDATMETFPAMRMNATLNAFKNLNVIN